MAHLLPQKIRTTIIIVVIVQKTMWVMLVYGGIPYSGKVWLAECLANLLFSSVWQKKVWRMNRLAKGLSMVTTNLVGFSLANCRQFAKFAKLSSHQTFLLYGNTCSQMHINHQYRNNYGIHLDRSNAMNFTEIKISSINCVM